MLPSNNYFNENNPTMISNLFLSSTTSSLPYFPSSPFDHYDDHDFFLQNVPQITTSATTTTVAKKATEADEMGNKANDSITNSTKKNSTNPKKRSKKDRHSKINTAKGPRDRRMRLSLHIAKEFFGLQDMLGFDKASTTVEWLLTKAKHDIKTLGGGTSTSPGDGLAHTIDSGSVVLGTKSASSTSECEVISSEVNDIHVKPSSTNKEKTKQKEVRKPAFRPIQTKELREKAREKARERTKVKMYAKANQNQVLVEESNQVGSSWSPPLSIEVAQMVDVEKPKEGEYIVDNVMMEKWSPISFFNQLPFFSHLKLGCGINYVLQ